MKPLEKSFNVAVNGAAILLGGLPLFLVVIRFPRQVRFVGIHVVKIRGRW